MKDWFGLLIPAAFLLFCWYFWESRPFSDEATVYLAFCPQDRVNGVCTKGEEAAKPTHYRALTDQQVVLYWVDKNPPAKYEHCAVRDRLNWSCTDKFSDGSSNTTMLVDGVLDTASSPFSQFNLTIFFQVPQYKWLMLDWNTKRVR